MSLFLPRLIDDLEGRVKRSDILYTPGVDDASKGIFIALAKRAECFNFGVVPLERRLDKPQLPGMGVWAMPELTDTEMDAWDQGLIPLPAPICWYEYKMGNSWSGILLHGEAGQVEVQRVDYTKSGAKLFHGLWCAPAPDTKLKHTMDNATRFAVTGNTASLEFLKEFYAKEARGEVSSGALNVANDYMFAVYLTMMILSKSTDIEREQPPAKVNKARIARGDAPLPAHTIVTIAPKRFIDDRPDQGGTHASPRLHSRRSHLRHFDHQTANAKWSPTAEYNGSTGWWVTLIPRQLVGKRELGEITHEYRIT